jgi:hypothetical protein
MVKVKVPDREEYLKRLAFFIGEAIHNLLK